LVLSIAYPWLLVWRYGFGVVLLVIGAGWIAYGVT
jgi:hypothetical protein